VHDLESLGWGPHFEQQLDAQGDSGLVPARVIEESRNRCRVLAAGGEFLAEIPGRLRHAASRGADLPVTGDWVLVQDAGEGRAVIRRLLERRTSFSRRAAGRRDVEQVVAANVDTVFLLQGLDGDFNLRRMERYLARLWESGARVVVLLSKADLCPDPEAFAAEAERVAVGVPVHLVSAVSPEGLAPVWPYLEPGRTASFVGSSGVGKSTLVNRLLGQELQRVQEISEEGRGRHTTSSRRLMVLPGRGLLLDTPGMRSLALWAGEEGFAQAFDDVEALARECRFKDCTHGPEPGCAVQAALAGGTLQASRFESYLKLQAEIHFEARRHDKALQQEETRKWRQIHLDYLRRPDKRKL
jgi:ribosome biogenesis GTPase / thiamine phosphate phosphatase